MLNWAVNSSVNTVSLFRGGIFGACKRGRSVLKKASDMITGWFKLDTRGNITIHRTPERTFELRTTIFWLTSASVWSSSFFESWLSSCQSRGNLWLVVFFFLTWRHVVFPVAWCPAWSREQSEIRERPHVIGLHNAAVQVLPSVAGSYRRFVT